MQYALTAEDRIFVSRHAIVTSTDRSAISGASGSNLSAFVCGKIAAQNTAIRFSTGLNESLNGHCLFVGSTGTLISTIARFSTVFMVETAIAWAFLCSLMGVISSLQHGSWKA